MFLKIINNSGIFSPFSAEVYDSNNRILYVIKEETGSFGKIILRLTKIRPILSLKIIIKEVISGRFYILERKGGLVDSYIVKREDREILCSFKPILGGFKALLGFKNMFHIEDSYGRRIATYKSHNSFILGPQEGRVIGFSGEEISNFRWGKPSFFRTPRKCEVFVNSSEEIWKIISLTSAIIKALYFEFR